MHGWAQRQWLPLHCAVLAEPRPELLAALVHSWPAQLVALQAGRLEAPAEQPAAVQLQPCVRPETILERPHRKAQAEGMALGLLLAADGAELPFLVMGA